MCNLCKQNKPACLVDCCDNTGHMGQVEKVTLTIQNRCWYFKWTPAQPNHAQRLMSAAK